MWRREEAGRNDAGSREARRAEALPRGPLWGFGKILEYDRHYAESATQSHPLGVVFLWCREEAGRNDAGSREARRAEALPRGPLWGFGKILEYDRHYAESATQSHPLGCLS